MRELLMVVPVLAVLTLPLPSQAAAPSASTAAVEAEILSILGLDHRPQGIDRRRVVIPPAMLELYKRQAGQDLDTTALPLPGKANTVRSFTHTESAIDSRFPRNDRFRLHFNVTSVPEGEKLTAAELRLSSLPVERRDTRGSHSQRVSVSDIVRPGVKGQSKPILRPVDTKVVDSSESITLDILPASQRWREEPRHNHGLLVTVQLLDEESAPVGNRSHIRLRRSLDREEDDWLERQPVLFLYSDDGKNKEASLEEMLTRRKRASVSQVRKQKRNYGSGNCRKYPKYVDFAEIGWDRWVVEPRGYNANYCQGDCTFSSMYPNSTNHAIVESMVNSVHPGAMPGVSCVPTRLAPISIIYLNDNNDPVLKNYDNMMVVACGCR